MSAFLLEEKRSPPFVCPILFGTLKAYINPEIIWKSSELQTEYEGCYSVDSRLVGIVERPKHVIVSALDREGNRVIEDVSGLAATIFQHEIAHLEGLRFPDRVESEKSLLWVEEEEHEEFKKNWQNWTKTCPLSSWQKMKSGSQE